ncbi:hypothetical protein [Pseudobacteriovorax antillogorgiicola]|uniref:Uncharacterized protein n=1 Tax=Pseudobacteriovorax antillogorgiicola TaxID=1513793 RepID=A0A1Y6CEE9_9BACT|nr:hypothetical protein [Pseudobacteriovorax antillogorgiicola]TCS47998.1 hypothetical protein EDD56_119109 [Pseudobacteriovorax antillogorgiicola]SMF58507.1 hypothetical protein SAMN06296036_119110 [Pseudobacteriovorax antillogorgiicola]
MSDENYDHLVSAIENIAEGLQKLALLSMDLKEKLDAQIAHQEKSYPTI